MRYARMIRSRRRPTNLKLGHKLALHLRHSPISSLVAILVISPFFLFVILSILRPKHSQSNQGQSVDLYHLSEDSLDITRTVGRRINITVPKFLRELQSRRSQQIPPNQSISLIAACMNRRETLSLALPSWEAVEQIDEIILVDWSSKTSTYHIPTVSDMITSGRLSLITVENASSWILSRAYNLAARFATGKYILKVDCDTHLDASFFQKHPLPPKGRYYTTTWGTERNSNEQRLHGVWFANAEDFRIVGGYDERIVEYGYEDTDLYKRFDTFLEVIALDLDTVRHNIAGDLSSEQESVPSKRISTRMNEAFVADSTSWSDVLSVGNSSTYNFSYDKSTHVLYASITKTPASARDETSVEEVQKVKLDALQKALHDDFSIPWDILPSLKFEDLEYLAGYLDSDQGGRVIITVLESRDTLSNLFTLVSGLQLGITTGRPMITIWASDSITPPDILLSHLLDISETNEKLKEVLRTKTAMKHGITRSSRVIPAARWACVEGLSTCAKAYDKAYSEFSEVSVGRGVYDETNPLPIPVRRHVLLRLNETKLGGLETRSLAYWCVRYSELVKRKMQTFDRSVGMFAASALNYSDVVTRVRAEANVQKLLPIVGPGATTVRHKLWGSVEGLCGDACGVREMAMELANVVSVVAAEKVIPEVLEGRAKDWQEHEIAITRLMLGDLRKIFRQKRDFDELSVPKIGE